jgi:hypothetical protein
MTSWLIAFGCAFICGGLVLAFGYFTRPRPEPSPRDLEPWGDYPDAHDLDDVKRRR